jgi:hypothetical protein
VLHPIIQYADDTRILLWVEDKQVCHLQHILETFATTTGVHINFQKSTSVPLHVNDVRAAELAVLFRASPRRTWVVVLPAKLSVAALDSLVVKVECSILGWYTGLLFKGAHLTLAEVVLSTQAVYAMSVATLPVTMLECLDRSWQGLFWADTPKCSGARARLRGSWHAGRRLMATSASRIWRQSTRACYSNMCPRFSLAIATPRWIGCRDGAMEASSPTTLRADA